MPRSTRATYVAIDSDTTLRSPSVIRDFWTGDAVTFNSAAEADAFRADANRWVLHEVTATFSERRNLPLTKIVRARRKQKYTTANY